MLKAKIHFAALFGIAFDADLIDYWIPHYKALQLNSYSVFLHQSLDPVLNAAVEARFIQEGFRVTILKESVVRDNPVCPGDPGEGVRSIIMDMVALSLPEEDYLITADADEFQDWPDNPYAIVSRGIKLVLGELLDCFDETLHAPDPKKSLRGNYPICEFNLSRRWREVPLQTKKICMAPTRYPVDFSGSHGVRRNHQDVTPRCPATGPIPVHHYRWRESAFTRVMNRPYWPDSEIKAIKHFFGIEA